MKTEILEKCVEGAFAGTMTFGETIGHMDEAGVEWYSANLIIGSSTHYRSDGVYHQVKWPDEADLTIARTFDNEGVVEAIRAIQRREIIYPEFLRKISEAGVTYYTVHMGGRRAIYFGRHGESHVELFPSL